MLTSSLFKDYFEMVLARQEQGLAKNHTCRHLRTTTTSIKINQGDKTHLNDDYPDYSYHDNNIHIAVKRQRLKTGGLANSRGTNLQSVIPSLDGSKAG